MIKYAVAKTDSKSKITTFKINDQDPIELRNTTSRQAMCEWLNNNDVDIVAIYEVLHVAIPKEVVCWYEE